MKQDILVRHIGSGYSECFPFDGFITSFLTLTADAVFSGLTERQMDAILTAYRYGYYSLPRDADVQTIATRRKHHGQRFRSTSKRLKTNL